MKLKHTNLFRTPGAIVISCGFAASGLFAQSVPATQEQKKETSTGSHLPTLVVTGESVSPIMYQVHSSSSALFADTPLIETPFSVSVYDERLMEDQRAFTLKEVLENDPSVALHMPGGYYNNQNFSLRGFQVENLGGYRVDGLAIVQTAAPYLDDKARVELLKGPAALRFGFMPPGGAINLIRKRPTQDFSTSISADINTFGNFYSQLDVSDTVTAGTGTFGYRVVLADEEFDSFYDHADGERRMGSLFLEWKPTEAVSIWASISGQNSDRKGYYGPMITATGTVLDTGVKTNIMQDWAHNDHSITEGAVGADFEFNKNWKLRTSFNYQETDRDSELTYPYAVQDNGDFIEGALLQSSEWTAWGAHAHIEGVFETGPFKHNVVLGGEYRTTDTYSVRTFPDVGPNNAYDLASLPKPAPGRLRVIDYNSDESAFFLTDTVDLTDQWSVLLGARYNKIDNTDNLYPEENYSQNAWSPAVALMYEPIKKVHTYVSYTQGLQDGTLQYDINDNPVNLGPQESEQWEVGVKTEQFDGRLAAELAFFQIERDLALQSGDSWAYDGLQRHRGVELSVRGKITNELQAGFAAMLLNAKQVDTDDAEAKDKRPKYVPEYQVNLWSVLEIPQVPGLALTANARFVDKQYLDQHEGFATDSYTVVDLGARYRFKAADADWTVRLNVQNVLDERYYESGEVWDQGTVWGGGAMSYGAPIAATLSLQVEF
ncbi:MAG: TonB-dependent siderophore receptor [Luteolibacter sp.]